MILVLIFNPVFCIEKIWSLYVAQLPWHSMQKDRFSAEIARSQFSPLMPHLHVWIHTYCSRLVKIHTYCSRLVWIHIYCSRLDWTILFASYATFMYTFEFIHTQPLFIAITPFFFISQWFFFISLKLFWISRWSFFHQDQPFWGGCCLLYVESIIGSLVCCSA